MQCKSILVVEDDEGIRNTLHFAIEGEGYQVFAAANGREALDLLSGMPKPCLILLDLMMPVMNGWEFSKMMQEDSVLATIPIVIVTAYSDQAKTVQSRGVLKKPVELSRLFEVIRRWCPAHDGLLT